MLMTNVRLADSRRDTKKKKERKKRRFRREDRFSSLRIDRTDLKLPPTVGPFDNSR